MTTADDLHVLRLADNLLGFYAGRVGETSSEPQTWVDEGALALGICSYAILDGTEAIVYDTHVSVAHARQIRDVIERLGARRIRVVLSHWHLDHVAGTEAFADCEVIANQATADLLEEHRSQIETGTLDGPPAIAPLILPTTTFESSMTIDTPSVRVELVQFEIHSSDATVILLRDHGILLAGDTVEDTVTYVSEPDRLAVHIDELERMRRLGASRLLPNHGGRDVIERGGYSEFLIDATQHYIRDLLAAAAAPDDPAGGLEEFVRDPLAAGWITWFAPYERVHEANLAAVAGE